MTFRPYPNAHRARHQLDRHATAPHEVQGLAALRSWSVTSAEAARNLAARTGAIGEALRYAQPNGAQAMENIAASLSGMPTMDRLFATPRGSA